MINNYYTGGFESQFGIQQLTFPGMDQGSLYGGSRANRMGSYFPPFWNPWSPFPTFHGNLPDSNVGDRQFMWWHNDVKGYGLDLDGDGRYTRGRDGVLAFDFNRDGKLSDQEIQRSNNMLKAFGGNFDLDGDGRVTWWERMQGQNLKREAMRYDRNRDGVLDANEIARAGGKVWIDRNRDGKADRSETFSPYNFPTPWFGRGSLGYVDPRNNYSMVWNFPPYFPPFPQPQPYPRPYPQPFPMTSRQY